MKKVTFINFVLTFCMFSVQGLFAQCMLKEVTLKQQVENSSLVVEGKVISKKSFWDLDEGIICTSNTIEVYKSFKGEPNEIIEIITQGGVVGLTALDVSTSLKLQDGDIGVFMLNKTDGNSSTKFKPYSAMQGFYKYDLYNDLAINPFNKKQVVSNAFYNEIVGYTHADYKEILTFSKKSISAKYNTSKSLLALGITSFSPTLASAGTKSVLTITGTDFGTIQGKVGFSDADEGGNGNFINALDSQVLSWTNSEITVEIPSAAGTGKIRVIDNNETIVESLNDLTISYSEQNVTHTNNIAYQIQHIDNNANGGYTWEMHTDFFNDTEHPGARAAFERAFDSWHCATKINWVISNTPTTTDVIGIDTSNPPDGEINSGDGVNVIRFDNGDELGDGVLGTCFSWYAGCGFGNNIDWFVSELDIVFDDDTNWHTGINSPGFSIDFESVALHELGHGHQLGHVINQGSVMHFAVSFGDEQRVLSTVDVTGAIDIQARSTTGPVCGQDLMIDLEDCNLSVEESDFNNTISLFPNPANNEFFIKNESPVNFEKVLIYDVSGRLMLNLNMSDSSYDTTVNVSGWSRGIYFVNIQSENTSISKKIILE